MARFISFRLDDGFIEGARKAAACLDPNRASFFIVANLVLETAAADFEPLFKGRDFGLIEEWRTISSLGHDVQLHGATHVNMTMLQPEQQLFEAQASLALVRQIHGGPYVFCYPYNAMTDLDLAPIGISGAGFETVTSDAPVIYNTIDRALDLYRLKSWAVRERHFDAIVDELTHHLPDDSWTILGFHSLDGEGHEPWPSEGFSRLVTVVRAMGGQIVTVAEMVGRLSRQSEEGNP